ncbi:MAG: nucleotide sugar dehydrogenase [Chloroflexota bacterium]|nr:nucleotide sugar dehydrogenase [Chloroflexota bacterium]
MKFDSLCVIGMGYIGLPTASIFASSGIHVTGMDINADIIEGLKAGELHIFEPGLRGLVMDALSSGRLVISTEVCPADAFIIAVPTPFYDDKRTDLRAVISAVKSILPHLKKGNLVILESTSPPRTTVDIVAPILEESGLKPGQDFMLAYSPERVLPGRILRELVNNARVIGGFDPSSAKAGRDLYRKIVKGDIVLTDATTAEMIKLMENTSRDINIAIANEFSRLAQKFNVDIWEAIEIANLHPRVEILGPGLGVGGHCISVDPWFLVEAAPETTELIKTAREINDEQPEFIAGLIQKAAGSLTGKTVALLGLAYKPNVDDLRESPAIHLAHNLGARGAIVVAYEPYKQDAGLPEIDQVGSLEKALIDADMIVLAVGHEQFKDLEPAVIRQKTKASLVFDSVNGWDKGAWENAGFKFMGLARKH